MKTFPRKTKTKEKKDTRFLHPVLCRPSLNILEARSALLNIRYGFSRSLRKITFLRRQSFTRKKNSSCIPADMCSLIARRLGYALHLYSVLLHGAHSIFLLKKKKTSLLSEKKSAAIQVVEGLLQVIELSVSSESQTDIALNLGCYASNHSWLSASFARRLNLSGKKS